MNQAIDVYNYRVPIILETLISDHSQINDVLMYKEQ